MEGIVEGPYWRDPLKLVVTFRKTGVNEGPSWLTKPWVIQPVRLSKDKPEEKSGVLAGGYKRGDIVLCKNPKGMNVLKGIVAGPHHEKRWNSFLVVEFGEKFYPMNPTDLSAISGLEATKGVCPFCHLPTHITLGNRVCKCSVPCSLCSGRGTYDKCARCHGKGRVRLKKSERVSL